MQDAVAALTRRIRQRETVYSDANSGVQGNVDGARIAILAKFAVAGLSRLLKSVELWEARFRGLLPHGIDAFLEAGHWSGCCVGRFKRIGLRKTATDGFGDAGRSDSETLTSVQVEEAYTRSPEIKGLVNLCPLLYQRVRLIRCRSEPVFLHFGLSQRSLIENSLSSGRPQGQIWLCHRGPSQGPGLVPLPSPRQNGLHVRLPRFVNARNGRNGGRKSKHSAARGEALPLRRPTDRAAARPRRFEERRRSTVTRRHPRQNQCRNPRDKLMRGMSDEEWRYSVIAEPDGVGFVLRRCRSTLMRKKK